MTQQEQEMLAGHIRNFLLGHQQIVTDHVDNFSTGIHHTSNFLPWHRVHVRELEYYIQEQLGWNPDELYLLPRWKPKTSTTGPNPIPVPFRTTYISGIVGIPGGATDPISVSDPGVQNIQEYCEVTDPGLFSNYAESLYHDVGHGSVGGIMAEYNAPAVLVFWPWHARVDDLWYEWEASDCEGGYTKSPHLFNIDIFEDEIWSGEHFVKGEVVVRDGVTLTIASDAVIHFRYSDYEAYVTRILVEPGGTLVVDGGKLTGIDRFGVVGDGGGGVEYHTGWRGVVVQGAGIPGGNHGRVVLKTGSVIEHAQTAVSSEKGGQVVATEAHFKNCRKGVEIRDYPYTDGLFLLQGCTFSNDEPLRDVTWKSAPIGGQVRTINFNHRITESSEYHVYLDNVHRVQVLGCHFSNEFKDYAPGFRTIGIYSKGLSTFNCTGGSFRGLSRGIEANHCGPHSPGIRGATFEENGTSIALNACTGALIADNTFLLGVDQTNEGIEILNSSWIGINNNTFDGTGTDPVDGQRAMLVENAMLDPNTKIPNSIRQNAFTGSPIQIQFQKNNPKVQFTCNSFQSFQRAVAIESGFIPDQGNCDLDMPAGNIWDNFGCSGNESQLFQNNGAGSYTYAAHSDRLPNCVSFGIWVENCNRTYAQSPVCGSEQSCNPPCVESAINALETQKQVIIANENLSETEKTAQVSILSFQQESIAQTGLALAINSDSTLSTALGYIESLEEEFTFDASQRIFLNLLTGDTVVAASIIAGLPVGNDKTLWQLHYTLHRQRRNYGQMTPLELQIVEDIAQGNDWPAARAIAILTGIEDQIIDVIPEPLDALPFGEPWENRTGNLKDRYERLSCQPNPSNGETRIQYLLPDECQHARFLLTDIFGRILRENILSSLSPDGEILIRAESLPAGIYFGCLVVDSHIIASIKIQLH